MNTKVILAIIVVAIVGLAVWLGFFRNKQDTVVPTILSYEDCVKAGYPIIQGERKQCKTPDGRTYAEETQEKITYNNASSSLITVDLPYPGAVTDKSFTVTGQARGTWYFEASFPIDVLDNTGKVIAQGYAQAQGEWMTENFVPFKGEIKVPDTYIGPATLVLHKDNPSGDPIRDASISFPITIEY